MRCNKDLMLRAISVSTENLIWFNDYIKGL